MLSARFSFFVAPFENRAKPVRTRRKIAPTSEGKEPITTPKRRDVVERTPLQKPIFQETPTV